MAAVDAPRPILLPGADLLYWPQRDWKAAGGDTLFACLQEEIPWQQEKITLFGKVHLQPRLICWMGDPECHYTYSGKQWEPQSWHPLVSALKQEVEHLTGHRFNSVLLNLYRDGRDSMGFHADDEPELGQRPVIASLSLGAARIMHFRHRQDRKLAIFRLLLEDSSLLLMRGDTQSNWKHAIPKRQAPTGPRLNLTFRTITRK